MKLEVASLVLSVVSVAGLIYAGTEARRATAALSGLGDRVAKLESAVPAAAPANGPSNADLAREIEQLRLQIAQASSASTGPGRDPVAKPPLDPAAAAAAKVKATEQEEQRQAAWLEALTSGIVKNLSEKLELSAQQQSQVADLMKVQVVQFRQVQAGKSGTEAKKAIQDFYADTDEKMRQLLTPEQRPKYDEIARRPGGIFATPVPPSHSPPSRESGQVQPR